MNCLLNSDSTKDTRPLDLTSFIIAYEEGELNEEEEVDLFQRLVNTGLAWKLQGHYGRRAAVLIDKGLVNND